MPTSPVDFAIAFSTGLVAFTLTLSGITKLGRSTQMLAAMMALRVPAELRRRFLARLVPVGELFIAVALLTSSGPVLAVVAAAAAIILIGFTALLIGVLRRGEEVECGCFGALSTDDRVSGSSVARNIVLVVASIFVVIFGIGSASLIMVIVAPPSMFTLALWLSWAILSVAVLVRALFSRRRSTRADVRPGVRFPKPRATVAPLSPVSLGLGLDPGRPGEVAMGDPIPTAELVAGNGATQSLNELGHGHPVLLIFLSAECSSCGPVAEAVPGWQATLYPIQVRIATSSQPGAIAEISPALVPLARFGSHAALRAIGVQRTPAAVMLGAQQNPVIASPIVYGLHEIEPLVQSLLATRN